METGAPFPATRIVGDRLLVAYVCNNPDFPGWNSGAAADHPGFSVYSVVLEFCGVSSFSLGPPSDERLFEHPLYGAGLQFYQFHEVEKKAGQRPSRWVLRMAASISITRDSGYADSDRLYVVVLNDREIGHISDGETKAFEVPPGEHALRLKIDWCGSKTASVSLDPEQNVAFRCGSALRGLRILLGWFYVIFARNKYLWLEPA